MSICTCIHISICQELTALNLSIPNFKIMDINGKFPLERSDLIQIIVASYEAYNLEEIKNMYIISVLNQKGGCGKTTISINIAHAFQQRGYKVLLVDSDPQGSTRDWNEVNDGQILPVVGLDRESLPKDIDAVKNGYDIIIIDGAPSIAKLSVAAVKISDLVLIPVQPSPWDIWATQDLVDIIKARQEVTNGIPKTVFIISRSIKNTKLSKEVISALQQYDLPILNSYTTQKVIYPSAASDGLTVFSHHPNSASEEINNIINELIELFNGIKN